ncbi:hypothetical protein ACIHFE_07020 [Streptomyces sp. NPDC052396]|uniref:hypothetical protein n=1 Tax=Streptomyces sp. NPDC052396 TaxID=3365689 RepID=UPI0037D7F32C
MTDDRVPRISPPATRLEELLSRARVRDRYADYDLAAAELRLRRRLSARGACACRDTHGTQGTTTAPPPAWTEPAPGAHDAGRALRDLTVVSLAVLHAPDAARDLERFIRARSADQGSARVFACLLHFADHRDGARFWWQFAAGAGDGTAEYCLFLDHSCHGEYQDADFWSSRLRHHDFAPARVWGDRAAAPAAVRRPPRRAAAGCITERHHPDLGAIPLPEAPLVEELRELTAVQPA